MQNAIKPNQIIKLELYEINYSHILSHINILLRSGHQTAIPGRGYTLNQSEVMPL